MVSWDVGPELGLMSSPSHGCHLGLWVAVSHQDEVQAGDHSAPQLEPRILLWKALEILFLLLFTCFWIMWKDLWNLQTLLLWDQRP